MSCCKRCIQNDVLHLFIQVDFQSLFQERIQMQESQLEGQNVSIEVGQVSQEKWAILSFFMVLNRLEISFLALFFFFYSQWV